MITVDHLTKRYGAFTALDDVSFAARPGRVTGFLGPNGAGKTTAMRVVAVSPRRAAAPRPSSAARTPPCRPPAATSASSSTPRRSTPAAPAARC